MKLSMYDMFTKPKPEDRRYRRVFTRKNQPLGQIQEEGKDRFLSVINLLHSSHFEARALTFLWFP